MSLITDAESLSDRPLPKVREEIAVKVADYFTKGSFASGEFSIACEIIRLLAKDTEVRVRKALSEHIKTSKDLPRDIALRMASDVEEVALPILEFSEVLTESDLIAIIKSASEVGKLMAISRRKNLQEATSSELINTKNGDVVISLFANNTAKITQGSLEFAVEYFKNSGSIIGALLDRGNLHIGIVEKIVNAVSSEVKAELIVKHNLKEHLAKEVSRMAQERVTLGLLEEEPVVAAPKPKEPEKKVMMKTEQLVDHLFKSGRLTESLIFRALCEGNLLFFEVSLARRAGIPIVNVRTLIHDGNKAAMQSLWRRAKMPETFFEPIYIMVRFAVSAREKALDNKAYRRQLLEYLHDGGFNKTIPFMTYFVAIISNNVLIDDVV